jgi:hypothetical protein
LINFAATFPCRLKVDKAMKYYVPNFDAKADRRPAQILQLAERKLRGAKIEF